METLSSADKIKKMKEAAAMASGLSNKTDKPEAEKVMTDEEKVLDDINMESNTNQATASDSNNTNNSDDFSAPKHVDTELVSELKGKTHVGNTSSSYKIDAEVQGLSPLTLHIPNASNAGFSSAKSSQVVNENNSPRNVRPATSIDLRNLTEADIMNMPSIEAKGFDIPAMLQLKPKEARIRFRWVNYKNYEGGNYAMFKAIGFVNTQPEDVEGPLSENLITEDGTIKFYDVICMKVDVLKLMQAYKANIIAAQNMVNQWSRRAKVEAERTIKNELGEDIFHQIREAGHTVEFFNPGSVSTTLEDNQAYDKSFSKK